MSSSKECSNPSNGVTYSRSSPESSDICVPASYIQIQNELTPARSPGSCKVRFSEKTTKHTESHDPVDKNRSRQVSIKGLSVVKPKYEEPRQSSAIPPLTANTISSLNGILQGKVHIWV